jgi:phage FluMu protein Com
MREMDRVSDKQLETLIDIATEDARLKYRPMFYAQLNALTELWERRAQDNFTPGYYPEMVCPKCKLNTIRYDSGEFMFKGFRCTNCDWIATEYSAKGPKNP